LRRKASNVLVPGASAPAGINTIKSLKLSDFKGKVLSTDSNELSAGFYLSDYSEVIPEVDQENYLDILLKVIDKYDINLLMPSSGHDIFPFSENKRKLKENGVIAVVSDRDVLEICRDKILTFNHLNGRFNLPPKEKTKLQNFQLSQNPGLVKAAGTYSKSMTSRSWITLILNIQI